MRSLVAARTVPVVGAAVLLAAVAIGFVVEVDRDRAGAEAEAAALADAGAVSAGVSGQVAGALRGLDDHALQNGHEMPVVAIAEPVEGLEALSYLQDGDDHLVIVAGAIESRLARQRALRSAAHRARDTGEVQLSEPVGAPAVPVLVVALYDVGGQIGTSPAVDSLEERRGSVVAYLAGVVDVAGLVAAVDGVEGHGTISDGGSLLWAWGGQPLSGRTAALDVDVEDRRWTVTAATPVGGGLGAAALAVVVLVGLTTLAFAGAAVLWVRRYQQAVEELEDERGRTAVIGDLTPVLQHSLRLADVLPSLAVQLRDRFDLDGVSVAVSQPGGEPVEVFCEGVRPSEPFVLLTDVDALANGNSVSLPLTRAGRLVAELRLATGRALDQRDAESIHASAELVTSAIVTAQAIDRQQRAMEQLTELDSLKTVFLSTAAHELRTPVAAANGLSVVLRDHWDRLDDAERQVIAQRITANTESLGSLVQDLLDFSRLETGELTLSVAPVEPGDLVASVVERQALAWPSHPIVFHADEGPGIMGDPLAIERITTNLVSNAVKYSPDGTTVHVTVRHGDGHAEIVVDDEGPGVPVEERERIFERFYRGDGVEVVRTRGVGIGLSVVREFVRKLDGTVTVLDAPSGGARFVCRFPHIHDHARLADAVDS